MRKTFILVLICFIIVQIPLEARSLKKVFVEGGMLELKGRTVFIESFKISKYEITNAQFADFLNAVKVLNDGVYNKIQIINTLSPDLQLEFINKSWKSQIGKENFPMVMVNYFGAKEFCNWIGGQLPTENEWVFAAKGGNKSKNDIFAGGNKLEEVGWYKTNSDAHSHAVGEKNPNELSIYDMSGNVWEWCLNDSLKSNSDFCVHKGGSWYAGEQPSRIDAHYGNNPLHFSNSVGFRVLFLIKKNRKIETSLK